MSEEELMIIFPSEDEKIIFMRWFKEKGFDLFLQKALESTCIASYEEAYNPEEEEYTPYEDYSYIEIQ